MSNLELRIVASMPSFEAEWHVKQATVGVTSAYIYGTHVPYWGRVLWPQQPLYWTGVAIVLHQIGGSTELYWHTRIAPLKGGEKYLEYCVAGLTGEDHPPCQRNLEWEPCRKSNLEMAQELRDYGVSKQTFRMIGLVLPLSSVMKLRLVWWVRVCLVQTPTA